MFFNVPKAFSNSVIDSLNGIRRKFIRLTYTFFSTSKTSYGAQYFRMFSQLSKTGEKTFPAMAAGGGCGGCEEGRKFAGAMVSWSATCPGRCNNAVCSWQHFRRAGPPPLMIDQRVLACFCFL
jgi:hypothetical protein